MTSSFARDSHSLQLSALTSSQQSIGTLFGAALARLALPRGLRARPAYDTCSAYEGLSEVEQLDHAGGFEVGELGVVVTEETAVDLVVVLTELGTEVADRAGGL